MSTLDGVIITPLDPKPDRRGVFTEVFRAQWPTGCADTGGPRIRDLGLPLLVRDIWRERERRALIDRLRQANPANAPAKARALARRFEAVRRVIADPSRIIAALARKLAALGKRARAFARRIAIAAPPRGSGRALANAVGYALYASYDLPSDDTS